MALNAVPETQVAMSAAAEDLAEKADVKLEGGRWERFESNASTDIPQDLALNPSRQSTGSSFIAPGATGEDPWISEGDAPQVGDVSQTKDWRPLTVELRGALAEAQAAEAAISMESMCPESLTPEALDWRPLTVTLRRAVAQAQKADEMDISGTKCPEAITAATQDWRPLATTLRMALAEAQEFEGKQASMAPAAVVAKVKETVQQSPKAEDKAGAEVSLCPAAITAETQDWRQSTSALRAALAKEKMAEAAVVPACPEHITAETKDWRPLATSLRGSLAQAMEAEAPTAPCPEHITAETEDWRPLTVALRKAFAEAEDAKGDVEVCGAISRIRPKAEDGSTAMMLVLALFVAVTLACRSFFPLIDAAGSL